MSTWFSVAANFIGLFQRLAVRNAAFITEIELGQAAKMVLFMPSNFANSSFLRRIKSIKGMF
jgi:hypothetical protein